MSKEDVIRAIRSRNQTASEAFLMAFNDRSLADYLARLTMFQDRRGRGVSWVRNTTSRAFEGRLMH